MPFCIFPPFPILSISNDLKKKIVQVEILPPQIRIKIKKNHANRGKFLHFYRVANQLNFKFFLK